MDRKVLDLYSYDAISRGDGKEQVATTYLGVMTNISYHGDGGHGRQCRVSVVGSVEVE